MSGADGAGQARSAGGVCGIVGRARYARAVAEVEAGRVEMLIGGAG